MMLLDVRKLAFGLSAIWGVNAVNEPEHLWVLVAQLRKKIASSL